MEYFYDDKTKKLLAYDSEERTLRELAPVGTESTPVTVPQFTDRQLFPTKNRKTRGATPKLIKSKSGCPECGSSSKHKSSCSRPPRAPASKSRNGTLPPDDKRGGAVSRMTFGRIKIAQSHSIEAPTVASNLDIDVAEVERAFECESYDEYAAV